MDASAAVQAAPPRAKAGQTKKRVARNAGIYFVVQLVSWCVTFVALSIVPRRLGEQQSGELVLAATTIQTVFTLGAMCMDEFLVRETGRNAEEATPLLRAVLGLRLCLLPLMLGGSYLALRLVHASPTVMLFGMLAAPSAFLASIGDPLRSALAGRERAREVSLSDLYLTAAPLFAIPFLGYGAPALIATRLVVTITSIGLKLAWLRKTVRLSPLFQPALWGKMVRGSVPFLLNNYVSLFNNYLALLVLDHFLQESAVGEFNQANRLVGTFLVVPTVLSAALLPALTRMAEMDARTFAQTKLRVLTVVIVSCLPVMVGVVLLAEPLCHLLYQDRYVHVPQTLQVGAFQLLPLYIIIISLQFLVAQGRNALWSAVLAGMLVVNTSLAWVLIPRLKDAPGGGVAAAMLADTLGEYAAMIAAFALMKVNPFAPALLGRVFRGALAAGAMGAAIWYSRNALATLPLSYYLSNTLQLVVPAALGASVFVGLAGLLKAFPPEEQAMVVDAVRRKLRRGRAPEPTPVDAPTLVLVETAAPEAAPTLPTLAVAPIDPVAARAEALLAEAVQIEADVLEMRRQILRYAAACSDVDARAALHRSDDPATQAEIRAAVDEERAASEALRQLARQLEAADKPR